MAILTGPSGRGGPPVGRGGPPVGVGERYCGRTVIEDRIGGGGGPLCMSTQKLLWLTSYAKHTFCCVNGANTQKITRVLCEVVHAEVVWR